MTGWPATPTALQSVGSPETDLVGFVWLVGFVLSGFLILARLSQGVVDDESAERGGSDRDDGHRDDAGSARILGESDSEGSPVAHPLAPDGAVGERPFGEDGSTVDRGDRPTVDGDDRSGPRSDVPAGPDRGDDPATVPRVAEAPQLTPGLLLLNVALTQGLFGAILAGGAWYFGVPLDVLGVGGDALSTGLPAVAVGVGFGVVLWVGNELASGLAAESGADYDEGLRELLAPDGLRAWALLLGATLPVIAVVEEFIFRAAVVGATTAAFDTSPWALAVVSSVAFALGHGAQGRVGVVVTGALGFALAAGFVLTNSLLVVVVAHYLVNALEFLVHEGLGLPDPIWS